MSSSRKKVAKSAVVDVATPELPVRWTRRAEADLAAIYEYIARDNPIAAEQWVEKLMERAQAVALAPRGGRVVPEFGLTEIREVFLRTYRIVYRIYPEALHVITVFEGRRQFPSDIDPDAQID